jgi:hypothetical protein
LVVVVFALGCVAAIAWRSLVLAEPGVPPGIDGGNWLAFGKDLFGENLKPSSVVYPPVVPAVITGLARLFGPTAGVSLLAGISAVAPAVAVFVLLFWTGLRWGAAILAAFLLPASAISEVAAWGGYPQLLGTAFLLLGLWFLHLWLTEGRRRDLVAFGLASLLVFATSDFNVVVGALAASILVGIDVLGLAGRRADTLRRAAVSALVACVAAVPFLPVYVRLVPAIADARSEDSATALDLADLPQRFASSLGGAWPVWICGLLVLPGVLWSRRRHGSPLLVVTVAFALSTGLLMAVAQEARMLHELPILAVLAVGLWSQPFGHSGGEAIGERVSVVVTVAVVVGFVAVVVAGQRDLINHRNFYNVLDSDSVEAINWIRSETPPGSLVAVSSVGGVPLGWWVEGLGERPTLASTQLQWLVFPEEQRRTQNANKLFRLLSVRATNALSAARKYGVDYILVVRGSAPFPTVASLAKSGHLGIPSFRNSSAMVLQVGDADPGAR